MRMVTCLFKYLDLYKNPGHVKGHRRLMTAKGTICILFIANQINNIRLKVKRSAKKSRKSKMRAKSRGSIRRPGHKQRPFSAINRTDMLCKDFWGNDI